MYNGTEVEFILLGFPGFQDKESKLILSAFFFSVYVLILLENLFIVIVIVIDENLHKPMYIFVCNLALVDMLIGIFMGSIIIPKMLVSFMFNWNTISFAGCFMQALLYIYVFVVQMNILAVMCYDRVLAVCSPLQYTTIMTNQVVIRLLLFCWTSAWILQLLLICFALRLTFCGPNKILNCYCNHSSIIKMSCSDYAFNDMLGLTVGLSNTVAYSCVFLISYSKILANVLQIKTPGGHRKAFWTCGSHLCLVSTTILSSAFVYVSSRITWFSIDTKLLVSMMQNFLCPLLNPAVYAFMTKDIKEIIKKMVQKKMNY
uniref:G-protein coupled receptors family 1 profile domain-containing protein n=1 Tax=Erpetoichthys calabaricus TaxID=27687 RepID=A0A8C4RLY3_ERPCA